MEKFKSFLSDISQWVYVVGSFARGEEHSQSDLDLYIRYKTAEDYDGEDTYIGCIEDKLIEYGYRYELIDCAVIQVVDTPVTLDISNFFWVEEDTATVSTITLAGVEMKSTVDQYKRVAA